MDADEFAESLSPTQRYLILAAVETYPGIPVVMHQDHGNSPATCFGAITNGFTSVMMDGSLEAAAKTPASYDYNVAVTREVVDVAHAVGVRVDVDVKVGDGKGVAWTMPASACRP